MQLAKVKCSFSASAGGVGLRVTVSLKKFGILHELQSRVLKGGSTGEYIGEYYKVYEGGCWEIIARMSRGKPSLVWTPTEFRLWQPVWGLDMGPPIRFVGFLQCIICITDPSKVPVVPLFTCACCSSLVVPKCSVRIMKVAI